MNLVQIVLTTEAAERIAAASRPDKVIRVNGELVGGCNMDVDYSLYWDEPQPADQVIQLDAMTFVVDPETVRYIDADRLTIDFRPQQGFRLVTPQQFLAYGIQLKERWT
ncbi:iron-sulfur cluster biosynthesis family protein [Brevibacillus sp. GCM10020057]|uniref:iron-sulfur cluster biosynthesis family protein n=1 Tax=Brevibacillus sp. GCM10020057 TaxID=3317327 RepID=UPI003644EB63